MYVEYIYCTTDLWVRCGWYCERCSIFGCLLEKKWLRHAGWVLSSSSICVREAIIWQDLFDWHMLFDCCTVHLLRTWLDRSDINSRCRGFFIKRYGTICIPQHWSEKDTWRTFSFHPYIENNSDKYFPFFSRISFLFVTYKEGMAKNNYFVVRA